MATNFKNGVLSRGIPAEAGGQELLVADGASVFWVDSAHARASNNNDGSSNHPLATLAGAHTLATASKGDIIFLAPTHAETWATAAASATLSKIGVRVIPIRVGSLAPTITLGHVDATLTISGASTKILPGLIITPSVDNVVSAVTISAADVSVDIETRDATAAIELLRSVITTAGADRLRVKVKHIGFITGAAGVNCVRLIGVDTAHVDVDFYGALTTAVVEFITTLSANVLITGTAHVDSDTTGAKLVVNTGGLSAVWYADIIGAAAGARFTGGSAAALASDDITAVNSALTTLQAEVSGAAGVVTWPAAAIPADTAVSLSEVLRQIYAALEGTAANQNGVATWPAAAAPANNVSIAEVLAWINDAIQGANGVVTFPAAAAPANGVALADVIRAIYNAMSYDSAASVVTTQHPFGKHVQKTANMQATQDDLFDVTGQVMLTLLYAEVTAALDGTITTMLARIKTDNVNLCAATTVTSDGDGTMYMASGDTGAVLNGADVPVIRLAQLSGVPLAPILIGNAGVASVIEQILGAADVATGVVVWHAWYIPLEASAAMAASA